MPLSYTEANLFVRSGEDMQRIGWSSDQFIREVLPTVEISGYVSSPYIPTEEDINTKDWRKA